MDAFSGYIKAIAIFLIIQAFVGIITPHTKYKKYIDLVTGLLLVMVIIAPLTDLFKEKDKPLDALLPKLNYKLSKNDFENDEYIQDMQNKIILDTYNEELKKQVDKLVRTSSIYQMKDTEFNIDSSDESFGDILSVRVLLTEKKEVEDSSRSFIRIDGVKVRLPNQVVTETETDTQGEEIVRIKKLVSDFYNISQDNIYITVQKREG